MTTPAQIRQAVTTALAGTELEMAEHDGDLVITHPARPDRGLVLIGLHDGAVFWQHTHTERYGHLEGTPAAGQQPVPTLMILHLLTATAALL